MKKNEEQKTEKPTERKGTGDPGGCVAALIILVTTILFSHAIIKDYERATPEQRAAAACAANPECAK